MHCVQARKVAIVTKKLDRTTRQVMLDVEELLRPVAPSMGVLIAQNREALEQRKADAATIGRLTSIIASQERTEERLRRFIGRMLLKERARGVEQDSARVAPVWLSEDVAPGSYSARRK